MTNPDSSPAQADPPRPAGEPPQDRPAEVTAPSAGRPGHPIVDAGAGRVAEDYIEAAELEALGWRQVGMTAPDGYPVYVRPVPLTIVTLHIDETTRPTTLTVTDGPRRVLTLRGGTNGELSAVLDDAVRCADCGREPQHGEHWQAQLALNPDEAAWRHTPAMGAERSCPA